MPDIKIRREMPDVALSREQFAARMREFFYDPAFEPLKADVDRLIGVAWDGYDNGRKAPRTRKAGPGYADPNYDLSIEWIEASRRIKEAERRQKNSAAPSRVLLINGAARSEHTCPGESSKSWRLVTIARSIFDNEPGLECEVLDLSRLTSEYGRHIHPCKTCVSTAMPLCHWPCSCYPNHSLGQVQDWMSDIYPMWAAAHGVMIVTPVNWYAPTAAIPIQPQPTARTPRARRPLKSPAGPILGIWPDVSFPWWCMATRSVSRRSRPDSTAGSPTWG